LGAALGLPGRPAEGDRVRLGEEGVVYLVNDQAVGVRTGDAMFRFLRGFRGPMVASHHLFAPGADPGTEEKAWGEWLNRVFG
jgi:hypothetical protein